MKKLTSLLWILLIAMAANAQPNINLAGSTKGYGLSIGYIASHIDMRLGINGTMLGTDRLTFVSLGYMIKLPPQQEEGYVSITPSFGWAKHHYQDASEWYAGGDVKEVEEYIPYLNLEVGRDISALIYSQPIYGRFFISGSYADEAYGSVGIRVFIKDKKE
jgi:hypothetical protein